MKKLGLLLLLSTIIFSCKKNDEPIEKALLRKWRYVGYSGGIASVPFHAQTSYHYYYTFSATGRYTTEHVEQNYKTAGNYSFITKDNMQQLQMTADGGPGTYYYFYSMRNDTLMLTEASPDATTDYYVTE